MSHTRINPSSPSEKRSFPLGPTVSAEIVAGCGQRVSRTFSVSTSTAIAVFPKDTTRTFPSGENAS
jgi:hypothetical protein